MSLESRKLLNTAVDIADALVMAWSKEGSSQMIYLLASYKVSYKPQFSHGTQFTCIYSIESTEYNKFSSSTGLVLKSTYENSQDLTPAFEVVSTVGTMKETSKRQKYLSAC